MVVEEDIRLYKESLVKRQKAGIIEFPPPPDVRKAVWSIANQAKIGEDKNIIYLRPDIKMVVKSRGWTKNGMIRLPVFHSFDFGGETRAG